MVQSPHRRDIISGKGGGGGVTHDVGSGTTAKHGSWDKSLAICVEDNLCLPHKMVSLANMILAYMVTYLSKLVTLSRIVLYDIRCTRNYLCILIIRLELSG